ncbi:MAG: energy transducer TonB [Cystobacterineae bacterium]|nr:energy transducer TonB [Cystobacterineae bacterium]
MAFVCLGFFLGLLVLGFNLSAKPSTLSPKPPPSSPFAYVPLSEQSWQKNRGDSPPLSLPSAQKPPSVLPPSPPKREPEKFFPNKQIVDVAPGNQQIDKNAEYIASTSNKVDKQTRARHSTAHYKNAAPQTTSTQKQQTHGQGEHGHISGNMGLGLDDRPLAEGTAARAGFEIPRIAAQSPLEVKPVPLSSGPHIPIRQEREAQQGNSERLVLGSHLGSYSAAESSLGHMGKKTGLALVPSYAALDKISGAAPNDHLADIEEGDGTFLSTREWKYASFFNRLKQSVGQHWHPNVVMQARDLNGQIYGSQDRYTLLSVKLHKSGRISHIQIAKSCGLHFLDEEAVAAFTRAAPFVNPPSNMFNGDEEIQFSFGFYLEISHGGLSGFLGRPRGGRLR